MKNIFTENLKTNGTIISFCFAAFSSPLSFYCQMEIICLNSRIKLAGEVNETVKDLKINFFLIAKD